MKPDAEIAMRFWTKVMMLTPFELTVTFLVRLTQIYSYLILARVLMSWIIQDPNNRFFHFLYSITEPILGPIRRIIPSMGLDLSPIIAFFILRIIARMLLSLI